MTISARYLFATLEPMHWLDYPMVKLGTTEVTALSLAKIGFWIMAVLAANVLIRHFAVRRVLRALGHMPAGQLPLIDNARFHAFLVRPCSRLSPANGTQSALASTWAIVRRQGAPINPVSTRLLAPLRQVA